jgi:CRP-like cAMP-binding protein
MDVFSFDDFWVYVRDQPSLFDTRRATRFVKGTDIFGQGEICPDVFVMTEGLVKLHYITFDGKEWIKSFIVDKGVFGSRASQSLGQPSTFSATCLEDCFAFRLPYKTFESVCTGDPKLAVMVFRFFQWVGLRKELREHDLLCLSAEERYLNFLNDNPALAGRITQLDMARYLGITAIALSRIKGRLSKA